MGRIKAGEHAYEDGVDQKMWIDFLEWFILKFWQKIVWRSVILNGSRNCTITRTAIQNQIKWVSQMSGIWHNSGDAPGSGDPGEPS